MYLLCTLYVALLFFVLTPGILLSLPPKASKYMVAATHALVFAVIYHFTHDMVWNTLYEGFAIRVVGTPLGTAFRGILTTRPTSTQVRNTIASGVSGNVRVQTNSAGNATGTSYGGV
jgi:hypothetical protein